MSQFKPKKLNIDAIHGGQKYPEARSPFLPSDANEIIEALYGVYEGVEKSAKRAYILTSGNSLIDISIKNNQVIIPRNTLIFGDNFLVSAPSITYLELTDNIKTLRFGVVYYVKEAKKFEITDYYETNNTYDNLYLFSFNFAGDNVVTDLPFEHLVNGEKKGGSGETPAIDASKTKKIYSVGEDYINISKVDDAVIIPVDTIFGEDIEFGNIIEFPFDEYLQEEGTYSLAVVFDRYIEDVEGGAIKFVNPIEILETPNYEWLFTLYFNGREFIHCDIDAPYYINGSLPTGSSVEIEQETGTRTDAVMSQKATTYELSTKAEKVDVVGINLFNYKDVIEDYYCNVSTGQLVSNKGNCVSYVKLDGLGKYVTKVNTNTFGTTLGAMLPVFDENKKYIGTKTGILTEGAIQKNDAELVITIDIEGAYYVGLTILSRIKQEIMFVKGDIYPTKYTPYIQYIAIPELKSVDENPLFLKFITVNGDSICAGAGSTGGYASIIAENNNMVVQNIAVGGGTIVAETYASNGQARHWICRTIENMNAEADFAIVEGGVNDASLGLQLGTISKGYNDELDDTTFYGAFESMLKQLTTRFHGKKIGYIAVHQMTSNYRAINNEETSYFWAAKKCCEKWGVPFLDLNTTVPPFSYFQNCGNPELESLNNTYTKTNSNGVGDGWHPNEEGYKKYYVPKIEAWLKTL